jgi:hypothetical protein
MPRGDFDGLVEVLALQQVVAADLFLRLGERAVGRLLEMGYNSGVITEKPKIDWVEVPEEVAKKA